MSTFSCYLIGGESLLISCAEILLGRGHRVVGVVSENPEIIRWAEGRSIPVTQPGKGLAERMEGGFDWLFSIANLTLISDTVLGMATHGAINFHDGPLPRYAGLNSPNWALLNAETGHGVSWHRIQGGVDEGNLLAQRFFDVAPLTSAIDLNTRCYEAAIESFPEVLERLERSDSEGEPQDLSKRTYFGKDARPPAQALIDWRKDAEEIVRLIRALDYGPKYPNPLHLAKLLIGDQLLLAIQAEVAHGSGEPGKVLEAKPDGAVIAAGHGAVKLTSVKTCEGQDVALHDLPLGDTLPSGDEELRQRLTARNETLAKSDPFWGRRLSSLDEVELPQLEASSAPSRIAELPLESGELEGVRWVAAVAAWLSRVGGKPRFHVGYQGAAQRAVHEEAPAFWAPAVPLSVDADHTMGAMAAMLEKELSRVEKRGTYARDLVARRPGSYPMRYDVVIAPGATGAVAGAGLTVTTNKLFYDASRLSDEKAKNIASRLGVVLSAAGAPDKLVRELPLLTASERRQILFEWNQTACDFDASHTVAELFEAQVDRSPEAVALVYEGEQLTYRELDERANRVARALRDLGVQADDIVGLYAYRTTELVVGALGIMKAGGAYLPLDPTYPADRVSFMLEDSRAKVVVTHREARAGLDTRAQMVTIDDDAVINAASTQRLPTAAKPENLAYVIYTSGSTGKPKGVMVEHRNVSNFFTGMDERIDRPSGAVWLAVTSLSFDISVLELFWTLSRGFKVVLHRDRERIGADGVDPAIAAKPMAFGLFYWGNDDGQGPKKYQLLLEGAKFGDRNGFSSIWTPERHFHAFGGPYPNPAVTGAAVAAVTKNLEVRAGSCVVPLHHPVRIAEEWAVIDNLTNGRVGLAIASGWQPEDFVLRPENTPPKNKEAMFAYAEILKRLWRGEAVEFPKEDGEMLSVVTQPRPVNDELQLWVTTAGNPDTYKRAGQIGANILTHLLGQSIEEVAEKIRIYRQARQEAGYDPATGKVTLMLHTYLADSREKSREIAREPMKDYLRSAAGLIKQYAWAFPAFKKPEGVKNPFQLDLRSLGDEEMEAILEFAFTRYFEDSGLFGTIEDAVARVNQCKGHGVDEIACLIDYGIPTPQVLESLSFVAEVIKLTNRPAASSPSEDYSVAAQIREHEVTHLQCTPSMARMLTMDDRARSELKHLKQLMVGGEALPGALVSDLRHLTGARIENMYGPTETTIWSSTATAEPSAGITSIGTPIANTQLYVLDANRQPVPVGVPGELYIGGAGVTRGYLHRHELSAERFVADPFRGGEARMYRTGDLVRWRSDVSLDFIGRVDHQVKIRGYRIELGEIETLLNEMSAVREAVVVAREDVPGDKRLVAYLTTREPIDEDAIRKALRSALPEYMVPSHLISMEAFPLTPNKKVDRKKLPRPEDVQRKKAAEYVAPGSETEEKIAQVWMRVLGVKRVGAKDNFFDLGGHSLLAVQAHRELKEALGVPLAITDIFRFPTLGGLASFVTDQGGGASEALSKTAARAQARREAMRRRRK